MGIKCGKQTYKLSNKPVIIGVASLVGSKEKEGPLGNYFKYSVEDDLMGEDTFEKAERIMMEDVIAQAIVNAKIVEDDLDMIVGGDLLNQLITMNYSARSFDVPFLGVYGACSTMSESLAISSCLIDGGFGKYIACCTGSHFSTAERQFRSPLEFGNQRQTYSQWTVTGMGCSILSDTGYGPRISMITFGKVTDYGIKDIANMGAAMAPAAKNTLLAFFADTNTIPSDYDLILTGDLGKLGSDILKDLMENEGFTLGKNYDDCGHIIYSSEQKAFQGGSGAGCSACVFNSYIYEKLMNRDFKKIIFLATGALMSTTTNQQGESIPGIAHLLVIEAPNARKKTNKVKKVLK
ncbi:MAG: stage V sporulation protein AD [Clostridia bacterium]